MTERIKFGLFLVAVGCLFAWPNAQAAEDGQTAPAQEKTKVVILVGGHGYDPGGFERLWSSFDNIAADVWPGAPYTVFDDISQFKYDVIVMYNLSSGITEASGRTSSNCSNRASAWWSGIMRWRTARTGPSSKRLPVQSSG